MSTSLPPPLPFTCPQIIDLEKIAAEQHRPVQLAREVNWPARLETQREAVRKAEREFAANPDEAAAELLSVALEKLRGVQRAAELAETVIENDAPRLTPQSIALFKAAFEERATALATLLVPAWKVLGGKICDLVSAGWHPRMAFENKEVVERFNFAESLKTARQTSIEAGNFCGGWTAENRDQTFAQLLEHVTRPFPVI